MDPATTTAAVSEVLTWISQYGYIALLPLFIIEGPAVGIASGLLISLGVLKLLPVFLLYILGTVISDSFLYFLSRDGKQYLRRIPFLGWAVKRVQRAVEETDDAWKQKFRDNYFTLMVVTRFTPINLVSETVVLIAGTLRIPPRKFYPPVLISQPLWAALMLAIGYFFGDAVADPNKFFTQATIGFVLLVAGFFLYRHYLHEYVMDSLLGRVLSTRQDEDE